MSLTHKPWILNGMTVIQAKLNTPAKFQTLHIAKCFRWCCVHWVHQMQSQETILNGLMLLSE